MCLCRPTKAVSAIMEEKRRRRERGGDTSAREATPTNQDVNNGLKDPRFAREF